VANGMANKSVITFAIKLQSPADPKWARLVMALPKVTGLLHFLALDQIAWPTL
jgi:hypothetical protein